MFNPLWVVPAGVLLLLLAQLAVALWPKRVQKKKPALPGLGYTLVYADRTDRPPKPGVTYSRMLHDPRLSLQGKPDLIYARGRQYIPVELKSGRIGTQPEPREGDLLQLAVYFFLVEAEYGVMPKEGRLVYRDGMFVIRNTRALRRRLTQVLADMQSMRENPEADAEPGFAKCRYCPCRGTVCEFADA